MISQKFNLMNDGFPSDFLAVIVFLESAPLEIITTMTQVKTLPIRVITSGPEPHRPTKAQTPVCVIWGKIEYSVAVSEAYFVQCGKGGKAGKSGWSKALSSSQGNKPILSRAGSGADGRGSVLWGKDACTTFSVLF